MSRFAFRTPARRRVSGDAVAMINLAFLLLIFFLLAARVAPPDPIEVVVPEVAGGAPVADATALFVGSDGALAYRTARGEAVFAALAEAGSDEPLQLRVDRGFDATALAGLLARLSEAGFTAVSLTVAALP